MAKIITKKSEDCQGFVIKRLSAIIPILQKVAQGDFTKRIIIPRKEDDFSKFLAALNLTIKSLWETNEEKKRVEEKVKKHSLELDNIKQALLNITDDLNKEKIKLEKEKAKDEAILASIGEGLFVVDLAGKLILINRAFEDLLGWKKEEVLGRLFVELVPAQDGEGNSIPPEKRPIIVSLKTGKETTKFSTGFDYFLVKKDKTRIPVTYKVALLMLNETIIGAVGVFRDVTEEREIDRAKTEFVSLASHELRTPLGIAKWYLEAIKDDAYFKNASQKINDYFNEIYKSNERLISLVRDLLSVSRIDQRRIKDNPQKTDVIQLIKDVVRETSLVATAKNIKLDLAVKPDSLPVLFIDPFRLHEVVENVIINAIEYNVPFGSVKVIVNKKTDDVLLVSIQDTGIGLSPKDQSKLFTKFFRSEKAVAKNPNGSGLGLYVVKSYVENWGGQLLVESREGKGSTFNITIPFNIKENCKEVSKR